MSAYSYAIAIVVLVLVILRIFRRRTESKGNTNALRQSTRSAPIPWPADAVLASFSKHDHHTIRDSYQNIACSGANGSGKSSAVLRTLIKAHLYLNFGAFFATTKAGDVEDYLELCRETGRLGDVVPLGGSSPIRLNLFPSWMDTSSNVKMLRQLSEIRKRSSASGGGDNAPFFENSEDKWLHSSIDVLRLSNKRVGPLEINRFIGSLPTSMDDVRSPTWQGSALAFECLQLADKAPKTASQRCDLELAADLILRESPQMASRTRTSIASSISALLDVMLRGSFRDVFCTGEPNFDLSEIYKRGAILLPVVSIKQGGESAALLQCAARHLFHFDVERRNMATYPRPVVEVVDEFQNHITEHDNLVLSTSRSAGLAVILAFQNLPTLYSAMNGGDKAKQQVDSLLGLCNTRIACNNACNTTNTWYAEAIGRTSRYLMNMNSNGGDEDAASLLFGGSSQMNAGMTEHIEFDVMPTTFQRLRNGGERNGYCVDTIVHRNGMPFKASGKNWLQVMFTQK